VGAPENKIRSGEVRKKALRSVKSMGGRMSDLVKNGFYGTLTKENLSILS
jgi:hypothetical protein